jgi:hypothetical protein
MKYKKVCIGIILIVLSSITYAFEKMLSLIEWAVLTTPILYKGSGGYNTSPSKVPLSSNWFILLFLITGLYFFISSFLDKNKEN